MEGVEEKRLKASALAGVAFELGECVGDYG